MITARPIVALICMLTTVVSFGQVGNNTHVLNPNLATTAELQALPQVSSAAAVAIVAARPLASTQQLVAAVNLSDPNQLPSLLGQLFVPLNLNTANREEIMLIPDMSARMAHEFEEYRPYTSLVQFRREMAKYVDAAEVARLEQFVFVPMDLNSASREDLMTIPGMTARMAHEFEEYRPYTSLEQFRREIGKYVDQNEVARLERYMTLSQ
jgi:DNA uptake protein ComE-like DNA-binding protein